MPTRRHTRAQAAAKAKAAERKLNDDHVAESNEPATLLTGLLRRGDGGQVPLTGHALELVSAALVKLKPRPDHKVAQRAGHEHVVRPGQFDSRRGVPVAPTRMRFELHRDRVLVAAG